MANCLHRSINSDMARAFQQIVTAGWANLSDGNVEAPTGHFALIHIEPQELTELMEAVFDGAHETVTIYPGSYLLTEDSDGNAELTEWLTLNTALEVYNSAQREFAIWDAVCPECPMEGPHTFSRNGTNILKCDNGHTWDPTEGVETKRSDMALELIKPGDRPAVISELEDDAPEKLYLVCDECGEAFDDINIAKAHCDNSTGHDFASFGILPESEAL